MTSILKRQVIDESEARRQEIERNLAKDQKIKELEASLSRAEAKGENRDGLDSELSLLRAQVERYFHELREEKQKRAQEEVRPIQ